MTQSILTLDIGNSSIQVGHFDHSRLSHRWRYSADSSGLAQFEQDLMEMPSFDFAAVASVNPPLNAQVADLLFDRCPCHFFTAADSSIALEISSPHELGPDRLANLYGAQALYPGAALIIDVGTAVTFDVLTQHGAFKGGVILPGFHMGARALAEQTAALPLVEISRPSACTSRTTEGNIRSGLYFGMVGALQQITLELKKENFDPSPCHVILTGGVHFYSSRERKESKPSLSKRLMDDLNGVIDTFEPDLTLIGLHAFALEYLGVHSKISKECTRVP